MKPGEILVAQGHEDIEINSGREFITIKVENSGDRPVQVGSHYHFFEVNPALNFDRDKTKGFRLNIVSGTAIRFEPCQDRQVELVSIAGTKTIYGFRGEIMGDISGRKE